MTISKKLSQLSILGIYLFDNLGFVIVLPIFSHLILDYRDPTITFSLGLPQKILLLGALLTVFPIAQLISAPLIGHLADRWGKKRGFSVTLTGIAAGYLLTAISLSFSNLLLLFIGRFVTGFFSVNRAVCLAAITERFSRYHEERASLFAKLTAIEGVAFILAISLGGFLSDQQLDHLFSFALPFWIAFGLSLLNLLFMLLVFQDSSHAKKELDIPHAIKHIQKSLTPPTVFFGVIHFLLALSWMSMLQFNSAFIILRFHPAEYLITDSYLLVGTSWALFSICFFRRWLKRVPIILLLQYGFFALFSLMLLGFISPNLIFYSVILFLSSIAASILWPASLYIATMIQEEHMTGKTQGFFQSMKASALIVGPIILSYLLPFDANYLHLFTSLVALTAFFLLKIKKGHALSIQKK